MANRTCSVEGCDKVGPTARGWCPKHYQRWRLYGDPLVLKRAVVDPDRACGVEGCERKYRAGGFCATHYWRFKKFGSTEPRKRRHPLADGTGVCVGPECDRESRSAGLCRTHYQQWYLGKALKPVRVPRQSKSCSVPDCGRPHSAHGLCKQHRQHMARYGEVREIQSRNPGQPCIVPGCDEVAVDERKCFVHMRKRYIVGRHGLTLADYDRILTAQDGVCAICGGVNQNGNALSVDHDHGCCPSSSRSCGKCIRGLLCSSCNHGLGRMKDDPARLRAAADYLERVIA